MAKIKEGSYFMGDITRTLSSSRVQSMELMYRLWAELCLTNQNFSGVKLLDMICLNTPTALLYIFELQGIFGIKNHRA